MKPEDLIALNDEIANMATVGLPLDQGLRALAKEMHRGTLRSVTLKLANDMQAGLTLPEALARRKDEVPPYYASLVSAGVRTGNVGEVLAALTTYARFIMQIRTFIVDAILYPMLVFVLGFVIFSTITFYLLPQIRQIYNDFHMKLPTISEWILYFAESKILVFSTLMGIILLMVMLILLWRQRRVVPLKFRVLATRSFYSIPLVGGMIQSARLASFCELLGIMLDHEVPLHEGMLLAGDACGDPVMGLASKEIHARLQEGVPLAVAIRSQSMIPEWIAWMTGVSESRGNLAETLHYIAESYRKRSEMRASMFRTLLPPLMVIITAIVLFTMITTVVILLMLKLIDSLSK